MSQSPRSACIVGATGGIGAAITRRAARDGYRPLVCMDLATPALDAMAAETGGIAVPIDLTSPDSIASAFDSARKAVPDLDAGLAGRTNRRGHHRHSLCSVERRG